MLRLISLLFLSSSTVIASSPPTEGSTLEYVFEIVRHGARAPIIEDPYRFTVSQSQMLTPMGMRQRYLLGLYNYKTYIKPLMTQDGQGMEFDLLSSQESFLDVQSTDVYRTLQSGYSELHGIFAALQKDIGNKNELLLTKKQAQNIQNGIGMPSFQVRKAKVINTVLKQKAIEDGFVNFPIYTYLENDEAGSEWNDDLAQASCPFVAQTNHKRDFNDTAYEDLQYLKKKIAPAFYDDFGKELNISISDFELMSFIVDSRYSDMVFAERYEGVPQNINWTSNDLAIVNRMLKAVLLRPFDDRARNLWVTKQLSKPLREMLWLPKYFHGKQPRYRLYSAHDTNVANFLMQINPSFEFKFIPYASNIYFELHKITDSNSGKDSRAVRVVYNGKPLNLEKCGGFTMCPIDLFFDHMRDHLYTGDLQKACQEAPLDKVEHPFVFMSQEDDLINRFLQ